MNCIIRIAFAVCCITLAHTAIAQSYPARALRLVAPFAPGGSTDTLVRIVGQRLTESLGQPVVKSSGARAE